MLNLLIFSTLNCLQTIKHRFYTPIILSSMMPFNDRMSICGTLITTITNETPIPSLKTRMELRLWLQRPRYCRLAFSSVSVAMKQRRCRVVHHHVNYPDRTSTHRRAVKLITSCLFCFLPFSTSAIYSIVSDVRVLFEELVSPTDNLYAHIPSLFLFNIILITLFELYEFHWVFLLE